MRISHPIPGANRRGDTYTVMLTQVALTEPIVVAVYVDGTGPESFRLQTETRREFKDVQNGEKEARAYANAIWVSYRDTFAAVAAHKKAQGK